MPSPTPAPSCHRPLCLALAALLVCAAVPPWAGANEGASESWAVDVGFLDFPTSGAPEAQRHFLRGVAILHSFGYKQAIEEFKKAQEIDPDFAMAYWGESLAYNHIFRSKLDLDAPREALARLAPTPEERLAKAPTEREKDFLRAVEVHFGESALGADTDARRIAYMKAMEGMHEDYPDDDEVAAFYAVALIAAVRPMDDETFRLNMKAGAIGLDLFGRNPDHPGAAHYIIHAFDDPVHAPLALPAAERFAEIAEAVSHARHMPSHIFIQRGMWQRVSRSNDSAYQAARDLWEPGDKVADMTHAADWGQYGDLQREAWDEARARREQVDEIVEMAADLEEYDRSFPEAAVDWMWAREVIESERWEKRPIDADTSADVAFASGLSALAVSDQRHARLAKKHLKELSKGGAEEAEHLAEVARVQHNLLAAKMEVEAKRASRARKLLDEAVAWELDFGPPAGTPPTVKPTHEAYGEALLALGEPREAIRYFEESLLRMPNRRLSLRGLARAHEAAGNAAEAANAYEKLAAILTGRTESAALQEAQSFLEVP